MSVYIHVTPSEARALEALDDADPAPLAISAVAVAGGLCRETSSHALRSLLTRGLVSVSGHGRGTRYRLDWSGGDPLARCVERPHQEVNAARGAATIAGRVGA